MNEGRARVVDMLKSYSYKKRQIEQLRFELDHPTLIGENELIKSLSIGASLPGAGGYHTGIISDKTMKIALQYQNIKHRMAGETSADIMQELRFLESEVKRLEYYVSFLAEEQANVIRMLYFEQKQWHENEAELSKSKRTILNYRNDAIGALSDMYSYLDSVKMKTAELPE